MSEKKTSSKHAGKKSGRYNPEEKTKELIQNINKICEIRGISHYTLAKRADISTSTLHSLLAGKTKPYMYTVYRLCNALDMINYIHMVTIRIIYRKILLITKKMENIMIMLMGQGIMMML